MIPGEKISNVRPNPATAKPTAMSRLRITRRRSGKCCIDVPGIGRMRQHLQPGGHRVAVDPLLMGQHLAFAERAIEARVAECAATRDAGICHVALNRCEFKVYCR